MMQDKKKPVTVLAVIMNFWSQAFFRWNYVQTKSEKLEISELDEKISYLKRGLLFNLNGEVWLESSIVERHPEMI